MGERGKANSEWHVGEDLFKEVNFLSWELKCESPGDHANKAMSGKGISGWENSMHEALPLGKEFGVVENLKGQYGQNGFWLPRSEMKLES